MHATRRPLIAGNWKMHKGGVQGVQLAADVRQLASDLRSVDLLLVPPYTAIAAVAQELEGSAVMVGAQNLHGLPSGAFTGEVSGSMLREAGATWVIVGHSERRQLFGERDADVATKAAAAFDHELLPIVCVGETLEQRQAGETLGVVERQVSAVLEVLSGGEASAIAYEPVWAIGTGRNASPADAEEVHAAIRHRLRQRSDALAARTRILYGGSVKPENALGMLSEPNVDGALVGGASLEAESFGAIARVAQSLARG